MRLRLNPAKLLLMFWPIYVLAALGLMLNPEAWRHAPVIKLLLLSSPVLVFAIGAAVRDSWWLGLTPDALVHHTLLRKECYEWGRMGAVELRVQEIARLPLVRTLWFPYPLDQPRNWREAITSRTGRRILLAFGDGSEKETATLIEEWRRGRQLG